MKNNRKALLLVLCAVMMITASIFGTLAYLTDTKTATNTFTVGSVGIELDDADVDQNGNEIPNAERVTENQYHLLPGITYVKDPTVTVKANSEESYIRMILTINKQDELDAIFAEINRGEGPDITINDVLTGNNATKWHLVGETETANNERVYEFRYHETVEGGTEDKALEPLFTAIEMPGAITKEQLAELYEDGANDNLKITVVAHAIQAAGFDNADAAWAAFNGQVG